MHKGIMVQAGERTVDPTAARQEQSSFAAFERYRYLVLRTFRRNGMPVDTPVWFARGNNRLYVFTEKNSGKVKRIRHQPTVQVAPSTATGRLRGPFSAAVARILPDDEAPVAQRLLETRYGWMIRVFAWWWHRRQREHVYLELKLPDEP